MVEQKTKSKKINGIGWVIATILALYIVATSGLIKVSSTDKSLCVELNNGN